MKLTPKEKAKNIYNQMLEWVTDAHIYKERNITSTTAKKCSLICVNELLDAVPLINNTLAETKKRMYYMDVQAEIQNL